MEHQQASTARYVHQPKAMTFIRSLLRYLSPEITRPRSMEIESTFVNESEQKDLGCGRKRIEIHGSRLNYGDRRQLPAR
jgi:hypothetical protein